MVLRHVEHHVVGGERQGAVVGRTDVLEDDRQGVVVIVEVVYDHQARLGHPFTPALPRPQKQVVL